MKEINQIKRSVLFSIIAVLIALVVLIVIFSQSFATLKISPNTATLNIDGSNVKITANGIAKKSLSPGLHKVKIEADGYVGYSAEINFKRGFLKEMGIALKQISKPVEISSKGQFLAKGSNFNDSYYLSADGKTIHKVKLDLKDDGTVAISDDRAITSDRLQNISEIIWSPTKDLALFRKIDQSVTLFDFMRYDFVHQTETAWGNEIGSIAWSPDNSKIAYYYKPSNGEKSLIFANLTNKDLQRVLDFKDYKIENPILRWSPDSERLLIIPRNSNPAENNIYVFNAYTRTLTQLTDTGQMLDGNFSPDSNLILYSSYSQNRKTPITSLLSVMNNDGLEKRSLELWADLDKVAWGKDSQSLVVSTFDQESNSESIFGFSVKNKQQEGFLIKDLGKTYINSVFPLDNGKIVLYQSNQGIFALKVE